MSDALRVMPSPRQHVHELFCNPFYVCRFRPDNSAGELSDMCKKLDELLDFNDEMLLHDQARDLREYALTMPDYRPPKYGTTGRTMTQVIADRLDPFVKVESFDPSLYQVPEGIDYDCDSCRAGKEHHHRKSDGSVVKSPRP